MEKLVPSMKKGEIFKDKSPSWENSKIKQKPVQDPVSHESA